MTCLDWVNASRIYVGINALVLYQLRKNVWYLVEDESGQLLCDKVGLIDGLGRRGHEPMYHRFMPLS